MNYTWWLNRQDADGNNLFSGGFLGLDNISPIDRSNLPEGATLEQADGTAWMAYYALAMLLIANELEETNVVYEDMVIKFLEHFIHIANALEKQGLYDEEDAFYYDRLVLESGFETSVKVRTIAGLIPLLPAVGLKMRDVESAGKLGKRFARVRQNWMDGGGSMTGRVRGFGEDRVVLVSVTNPSDIAVTLREFFDEAAFLSPYGLRSVSKGYLDNPYTVDGVPGATIDYQPAESVTGMFGGNSNWRGPIWMPLNYLAIRQFEIFDRFFGTDLTVEYPTGSGNQRTLGEVANDLSERVISIWLPGVDGCRPVFGDSPRFQHDPEWKDKLLFFEYFHADNGAGLGASHQTGWTALVVDLILDPPTGRPH